MTQNHMEMEKWAIKTLLISKYSLFLPLLLYVGVFYDPFQGDGGLSLWKTGELAGDE